MRGHGIHLSSELPDIMHPLRITCHGFDTAESPNIAHPFYRGSLPSTRRAAPVLISTRITLQRAFRSRCAVFHANQQTFAPLWKLTQFRNSWNRNGTPGTRSRGQKGRDRENPLGFRTVNEETAARCSATKRSNVVRVNRCSSREAAIW